VLIESQGFPIGLSEEKYEERSIKLGAGDRLYLYSDGVSEAMNPSGKQFGDEALLQAIGRGRSQSLKESVASVVAHISQWHGTAKAQDDISILAAAL
jgi:sigma-B regulation protein RsbU (phosphoserine phosphatase)